MVSRSEIRSMDIMRRKKTGDSHVASAVSGTVSKQRRIKRFTRKSHTEKIKLSRSQ